MILKGTTALIGMIGDPIAKASTPSLLNPRISASGADMAVVPLHVPVAAADQLLPALLDLGNLQGLIITYPFKETCLAYVTRCSKAAELVGGVNAMRREADGSWSGEIFDGLGLLNALRAKHDPQGSTMVLIGAGGAGRAIAVAFAEAGVSRLVVIDLDHKRAAQLVEKLRSAFPDQTFERAEAITEAFDIVVNASTVGMDPADGLPCAIDSLSGATLVADIVPSKEPTALLRQAQAQGVQTLRAAAMTEGQAQAMLHFFGIPN